MATAQKNQQKSNGAKANGAKADKAKPKAPPTYGGRKDAPEMGANGRRLMAHLREEKGAQQAKEILATATKRTTDGKGVKLNDETGNFVQAGSGDRFIRWETIATVAGLKPADAQKLVRSLQRKPGAKEAGQRAA